MSARPPWLASWLRFRRRDLLRTAIQFGATGLAIVPGTIDAARAAVLQERSWTDGSGFVGRAVDVATEQSVAGAAVTATPGGARVTTDATGSYRLPLGPGSYVVEVALAGYVGVSRHRQTVTGGFVSLDLQLVSLAPTAEQQQLIYQRLVKQHAAPLVSASAASSPKLRIDSVSIPTTITVYYDQASPPYTVVVQLEDYVKGVVPNEVPWNWPSGTLQAQAVAARSYGVASQLAYGYVYPDTRSQVYDPTTRTSATDSAVDATAGQVMTYNSAVIWAYFYSCCNGITTVNSENAIGYQTDSSGNIVYNSQGQYICVNGGWNYVAYCRARSCGGHAASTLSTCGYYGHGVGMCQWGAYARGSSTYQTILNDYYTGIALTGGTAPALQALGPALAQAGVPITLTWTGPTSSYYYLTVFQGSATLPGLSAIATTTGAVSWPIGALPVGQYTWTVSQAGTDNVSSATLEVAPQVFSRMLPLVDN